MKICKQCNAAQEDDARFCSLCGASLEDEIVEEAAEDVSEATAAGEVLPEEPAEEPKKKTPWGWIIGLAAAVIVVVALILVKGNAGKNETPAVPESDPAASGETAEPEASVENAAPVDTVSVDAALHTNAYGFDSYSIHYETDESGSTTYSYRNEAGELVYVDPASVEQLMGQVLASVGSMEMTNRDLQYFYDQQFSYFYSMYSSYLSYVMDTTIGLDEQQDLYGTGTWQEYFLSASQDMFHQVAALYQDATEKGFQLTEEQQASMEASLDLASLATSYGYTDAEAFMKDFFGPYASVESYQEFLRMGTIVGEYAAALAEDISVTPEEVEAYYDANAATIQGNYGIEKIEKNVVNIRHILIQPAASEDGSYSDEAWAAAETEAQRIYDEWKAGAATEESFAEAAGTYTQDPGSQTTGGLYEDVYPGQMVTEFNDWCFADGRQVGDTGIVKTSYGYHIMFFSGEGEYVYWRMAAEDMVRTEKAAEVRHAIVEGYPLESDMTKALVLDSAVPTVPAVEEPAEGETAE